MSAAFDTLNAARRLEAAGMDPRHAEVIVTVVREGQGELATKGDIRELNTRLSTRIEKLDDRLGTLQWIIGIVAATSMATLGVMLSQAL